MLGQLLLSGVPGPELDSASAATFRRLQPGGYILFGRNIKSPVQLRKLVDDLRDLSLAEPIITIDQEGGRVSRLREIGSEPPSAQQLREKGDPELIRRHGQLTGQILRLFGFNLDLCPVLDISCDGDLDNSLRNRCHGLVPSQVITNAGLFNRALRAQGVLTCGKHFPGYGRAKVDPHHELPEIPGSLSDLANWELLPYQALLPELDSIMSAHAFYPGLERGGLPASLSHRILQTLLKKQLGFTGLLMTDDLDMGAILNAHGLEDALRLALHAGNDLLMICHRIPCVEEAAAYLEKFPRPELDRALANVAAFKQKLAPPEDFSESRFRELDGQIHALRVATLGEELARARSAEDGKRSPVELY